MPKQLSVRAILASMVFLAALVALNPCSEAADTLVLQREWTANAEFAGDIWTSQIAARRGINIEVREGSELIDPIKMVRAGNAQFGVASADRVLLENQHGAGLVIVAAATFRSPVVFLTRSGLNIGGPRDFIGHTVGIQPGTNTDLVLQALATSQKIPLKNMQIVDSGWGTQLFETGKVDILGAFVYDEPITLQMKKFPMGKTIVPEDYGVHYVGTVYFSRKDFVTAHPELTQAFLNALVEGWTTALAHPDEAVDMLASQFESVRNNIAKEKLSFAAGRLYFAGKDGRILFAPKERWDEMASSLRELGKLITFDFVANVDYRFLDKAEGK